MLLSIPLGTHSWIRDIGEDEANGSCRQEESGDEGGRFEEGRIKSYFLAQLAPAESKPLGRNPDPHRPALEAYDSILSPWPHPVSAIACFILE